jgi:hypothetical protein
MQTDAINPTRPSRSFIRAPSSRAARHSGHGSATASASENKNLPAFVVLLSTSNTPINDQPLFSRLWGSGFLPSNYQGVRFRSGAEPVLFLQDPEGIDRSTRRMMLDGLEQLNRMRHETYGDPEIENAHRAIRDGVQDAIVGAGPDGLIHRARGHVQALR